MNEKEMNRRVGEQIARRRNKKHLTQQDVSEMCGLSRATIACIEAGNQSVHIFHLAKIAKGMGFDIPSFMKDIICKADTLE